MLFSTEVQHILRAAQEYADGAGQPLTTGHILLGMITQTSRAGRVLKELRLDLDKVLHALSQVKRADRKLEESDELITAIEVHMVEAANRSSAALVSSLHLLLAVTREKHSVAYKAFVFMGIPPVQVRTLALGGINGPVPRQIERHQHPEAARVFRDEPSATVAYAEPARPEPKADTRPRVAARAEAPAPPRPPVEARAPVEARPPEPDPDDPGAPWLLDAEAFPVLTGLGRNLTADAARGKIDPVIGRAKVIDTVLDVLHKRRANNPCLVGEPGVGKTAIVEGLALAMLGFGQGGEGQEDRGLPGGTTDLLREKVVIALDVGSLVAGTELRGAFSRRMAKLKDEVRAAEGRVVVFIDELHTLVGAGSGEGALDAANDLKAALARGEFPCIGATTPQEYHRYIEKDPALERRFQPIEVPEPSEDDALGILRGVIEKYENHHGVLFEPEALSAAVRMSRRYIVERRLPDKAFNLVDTAAARVVRQGKEVVAADDVASVVSELTKIPIERLLMTDAERILRLRDFLGERVIGHDEVLDAVADVIQRNSAGFASKRPIGSFLFLGPSGVGKTETAKVLADFLFCSKEAMTRIDMSELMERHAVSRLLGAAPGYVGHEEAGQLTAALARRPYQIVLFDEVEKAHPDVLNLLLQVLDEGRLTDAKGRALSFQNTVIIMTSNLGAEVIRQRQKKIGFAAQAADGRADELARATRLEPADVEAVLKSAQKALPPELWGRVDEKCVFAPLGPGELLRIAELLVAESSGQLAKEREITYEVTAEVLALLVERGGGDPTLGARPLRRAVQRTCETAIARAVLRGEAQRGDHLVLHLYEGELMVVPAEDPADFADGADFADEAEALGDEADPIDEDDATD